MLFDVAVGRRKIYYERDQPSFHLTLNFTTLPETGRLTVVPESVKLGSETEWGRTAGWEIWDAVETGIIGFSIGAVVENCDRSALQ